VWILPVALSQAKHLIFLTRSRESKEDFFESSHSSLCGHSCQEIESSLISRLEKREILEKFGDNSFG
jgi:hypothetical protein